MTDTCTSEQALQAVSALQAAHGGYPIGEDDKREYLRLFSRHSPRAVRAGIDLSVERFTRKRPTPAELAELIRLSRPSVPDTRNTDPVPEVDPEHVSAQVQAIKEANALR